VRFLQGTSLSRGTLLEVIGELLAGERFSGKEDGYPIRALQYFIYPYQPSPAPSPIFSLSIIDVLAVKHEMDDQSPPYP
jgi:hypothetical protein